MTILPPSPPYRGPAKWHGADNNKPINRVVVHATDGTEPGVLGAAEGTIRGSKATTRASSFHYVADSKVSLQYVYDSVVAYHAPPNEHSIGYELCCDLSNEGEGHWTRPDHVAMLTIAAEDIARLCLAYDVPIVKLSVDDLKADKRGICGHIDVSNAWHQTTHWDPGPHFPWASFIERVKAAAKRLQDEPEPEPTPEHGPEFTVAQVSGRFDASEDEWQAALERAAEASREHDASVRIITETSRPGIPRNVKEPGVSMTRLSDEPGQDEITILWDRDIWEKASEPYAVRLTETTWHTGTGHAVAPRWATVQPLRHKASDRVALIAGFHAPNDDSERQRAAHGELMDALNGVWDIGRERHPDAARVVGFDLNLDMRLAGIRALWAQHAPKLALCWNADNLPDRGTIGKVRVIDGVAHGVGLDLAGDPEVLDLMPGMDHRCVIVPMRWAKS